MYICYITPFACIKYNTVFKHEDYHQTRKLISNNPPCSLSRLLITFLFPISKWNLQFMNVGNYSAESSTSKFYYKFHAPCITQGPKR